MFRNKNREIDGIQVTIFSIIFSIIFIFFCMWANPIYSVWQQGLAGEAELSKANYSKKVAVQEAQAKLDSSLFLARAEVNRAEGVAKANKIIGESLKQNEDYLRYLWIIDVAGTNVNKTVVYVPTETNMPILEATRHQQ